MDISSEYRKKTLRVISVYAIIVGLAVAAGCYYLLDFGSKISADTLLASSILKKGVLMLPLLKQQYFVWVLPALMGLALLMGCVVWLLLFLPMGGFLSKVEASTKDPRKKRAAKKDFLDQKLLQERRQRLFLHTLSVLQRDGRLLDFFDEDLNDYEDDQIGAAVRSIQEDCQRAMKKYINPKPVIDGEEGDDILIEPGFDMDAIHLVGNVAGEPPFKGVLKHRGWKAGKKDVPKLSDIQDPTVICPAEVEIR